MKKNVRRCQKERLILSDGMTSSRESVHLTDSLSLGNKQANLFSETP